MRQFQMFSEHTQHHVGAAGAAPLDLPLSYVSEKIIDDRSNVAHLAASLEAYVSESMELNALHSRML